MTSCLVNYSQAQLYLFYQTIIDLLLLWPCLFFFDRLCGLVVRVPGYRFRGPVFDFRRYQIFWEVVVLERGPLSLLMIIEELLESKVGAPVYKTKINGRGDLLRWPRDTLYSLKLALTSPTSGGRSDGIVRWRTKAPEFLFFAFLLQDFRFPQCWLWRILSCGI
jgi:hypothetical protein